MNWINDISFIVVSFMLSMIIMFASMRGRSKIRFESVMLPFCMFITYFASVGAIDVSWIIYPIVISAYFFANLITKHFLGDVKSESTSLITYFTFFAITLAIEGFVDLSSDVFNANSHIFDSFAKAGSSVNFNSGLVIWDKILNGIASIISYMFTFFNFITGMFSFNSNIGAVNTLIFLPFGFLSIVNFMNWLRGRGGS